MKWANVIFPAPPYGIFTYEIPDFLKEDIQPGHRVEVMLGKRKAMGVVVGFPKSVTIENIKPILTILDVEPVLSSTLLELGEWMSNYYITHQGEVLRAMLPSGLQQKSESIIEFIPANVQREDLTSDEQMLYDVLVAKNIIPLPKLETLYTGKSLKKHLKQWQEAGYVNVLYQLQKQKVNVQTEDWIVLKKFPDQETYSTLKRRAPKQAELLVQLKDANEQKLKRSECASGYSSVKRLADQAWIEIEKVEVIRDLYQDIEVSSPKKVILTSEQVKALEQINEAMQKKAFQPFLLHGITGSGKTQVYIESIERVLDSGRQVIVLIPEIALTPQAVQRYRAAFGDRVSVLHSRMSPGERFDSWRRLKSGESRIALGPRSAIFAPLSNVGLIVVDEEHDSSYKQMDPSPRYNARDVAVMRGQLENAVILMGSATPSLESYYNVEQGKFKLCTLKNRIDEIPLPEVQLVAKGSQSSEGITGIPLMITPVLHERIEKTLEQKRQIILLQNRRGYSTFLRCRACGHVEGCPNCDITLTFHQRSHQLRCHYCGHEKNAPDICPACGGATFAFRGTGTQKVEEYIQTHFPDAKVLRMDLDTTRRKGDHDRIVIDFEKGEGDILIGTQMIAKGHDFPNVQLVGIVSADTEIYFPDFRSGERTFQLLTQAAGRAGRKDIQGKVVVQTQMQEHPILFLAKNQDYPGFYQWELKERQSLFYPPWGRIVLVRFKSIDAGSGQKAAEYFSHSVTRSNHFVMLGPVPCPLSKIKNQYRHQVIFRSSKVQDPSGKIIRAAVRSAYNQYISNKQFQNVRIAIDVDPQDMM